jgi:nitroreductase
VATAAEAATIKRAQPDHPIHELVQERWSPRAFDPRPVEAAKLCSVFEAARWAASGGNGQPWFFIVGLRHEQPELFARLLGCLESGNAGWAGRAPVLGVSVARLVRPNGKPHRHALHDVGLAFQNLSIQATALGLYVHPMAGFFMERVHSEFAVPAEHEAVIMFALGYLGDADLLAENHRQSELTKRTRRPLHEFVFGETWGAASPLVVQ